MIKRIILSCFIVMAFWTKAFVVHAEEICELSEDEAYIDECSVTDEESYVDECSVTDEESYADESLVTGEESCADESLVTDEESYADESLATDEDLSAGECLTAAAEDVVLLKGYTSKISSRVQLSFIFDLPAVLDENAYVIINRGNNDSTIIRYKDTEKIEDSWFTYDWYHSGYKYNDGIWVENEKGSCEHKVTVEIPPVDVNTEISVQYCINNVMSKKYSYTLNKYFDAIIANPEYSQANSNSSVKDEKKKAAMYNLVCAASTYCYYTEVYFGKSTDNYAKIDVSDANAGFVTRNISGQSFSSPWIDYGKAPDFIIERGTALILDTYPYLRYYFSIDKSVVSNISYLTFRQCGKTLTPQKISDNLYYIDVKEFDTDDAWSQLQWWIETRERNWYTYRLYIAQWCDEVIKDDCSAELKNVMKAYLLYTERASRYANLYLKK